MRIREGERITSLFLRRMDRSSLVLRDAFQYRSRDGFIVHDRRSVGRMWYPVRERLLLLLSLSLLQHRAHKTYGTLTGNKHRKHSTSFKRGTQPRAWRQELWRCWGDLRGWDHKDPRDLTVLIILYVKGETTVVVSRATATAR